MRPVLSLLYLRSSKLLIPDTMSCYEQGGDETRLSLRNSREMQKEMSREKAVCDQIVKIAEMEARL